jgi:2-polyprenyl-3-methyl-5-hydroxy-6-metoxy-1,4-benzoquinol methylase
MIARHGVLRRFGLRPDAIRRMGRRLAPCRPARRALVASLAVDARPAEREAIEGFYDEFSVRVGLRDWRVANSRHEQLKLLAGDAVRGTRSGARILDVGCGTGVMSAYMTRFGTVTGIDYSEPAVRLAASMVPEASFHVGSVVDARLPSGGFDVISLFDVLEHVPKPDRTEFAGELGRLLASDGTLIASTPHPNLTEWMREHRQDLMQVIEERVELRDVIDLFDALDLTLTRYDTYDIDRGGPQYQFMVFRRGLQASDDPRRSRRLRWRLRIVDNRMAHYARPWVRAADVARRGKLGVAISLLSARSPSRTRGRH